MAYERNAKSELLAEAYALLHQDDKEQAERLRRSRSLHLRTLSYIAALAVIALATLSISCHTHQLATHPAATPPAGESVQ